MSKYAPANEAGEKPYVVWRGWSHDTRLTYGADLRDALVKSYGALGARAANGRRATPDDIVVLVQGGDE